MAGNGLFPFLWFRHCTDFQEGVNVKLLQNGNHLLMGEAFAELEINKINN